MTNTIPEVPAGVEGAIAGEGSGSPVALTWQENLISFRPRMSGVQQPQTVNIRAWDPMSKQPVTGSARTLPDT